ncbi:hypothetical protein B484DRAFT_422080, partial [Ochromonadaceae sp. CCMP2298]
MDPVTKRISGLRTLVAVMLGVAAVAVGVGSYIGVSYTERSSAVSQFRSTVDAAVAKLDDNFYRYKMYVQLHPTLADWPNAVLPNFQTSAMLANEIGGCDRVGFAVSVKPELLPDYETFMLDTWDNDPAIVPNTADHGMYHLGRHQAHFPLAQLLYTEEIPAPDALGYNLYSTENEGEAIDRLVGCVDDNVFQKATLKCGVTSKMTGSSGSADYLERTDYALSSVSSFRTVSIVVGTDAHHEIVGSVGGQYAWSPTLSRIFAESVSDDRMAFGDVASKRYAQHKVVVANALVSRQFEIEQDEEYNLHLTFYPTEDFISHHRTYLPIIVTVCGVLLILLMSLVFVGYDVAVSGEASRKEIVLDTKRRFVRFVSHEIRTPMNAVRLGMTLFASEIDGLGAKLEGKSLEEVHAILEETLTDWRKIAVDVLDNSESAVDIESGSLRLEFSMVPVWKTLQRTFGTFVLQAREKDILAGDLAHYFCLGDDTRIAQVLRNLISNSLKFTKTRGTVTVRPEHLPNGLPSAVIFQAPRVLLVHARAGAVRITVVDDGAGLSPAQVLDICKERVQFNVNTLQAGGGSGLGLFIGKGIVEQHGGTLLVSSEGLGRGATFVIELPVFRVEDLDRLSPTVSPKTSNKGSALGGIGGEPLTLYLLVVDDAVSNRKLLVRILNGRGYVCREAADGQQALDVYQQ